MVRDRLHVNVVPLSSETAREDRIIPVVNIGVSEIEEYIGEGYGPGIPESERASRISRKLLDSMTALSTDEEYDILDQLDQTAWLPHWLGLAGPVVESARQAGAYVNQELTTRENNEFASRQPIDKDFQYMFSAFSLSSFVVAAELGITHPSDLPDMATARTDRPDSQTSEAENRRIRHDLLEALSAWRQVPAPHRRKLKRINNLGQKIVDDSVAFMPRLTEALKRVHEAES